eukprot:gene2890-3320_t
MRLLRNNGSTPGSIGRLKPHPNVSLVNSDGSTPGAIGRLKRYPNVRLVSPGVILPADLQIATTIKTLIFDDEYNQKLRLGLLPKGLTTLIFGMKFNHQIGHDVLPMGLTKLSFGWKYNQPIPHGVLPPSLTSLDLGGFTQPLPPGVLPMGLSSLKFKGYNRPLQGAMPSSVTKLTLGIDFKEPLRQGDLHSGITTLNLIGYDRPIDINVLPDTITNISFGGYFNRKLQPGVLPLSLKTLTFGYPYDQPLEPGALPHGLETLTLGDQFKRILKHGDLPSTLTSLTFGQIYNQPIAPGVLPDSLTSLTLGSCFDQPESIPMGLKSLTIKRLQGYNQNLVDNLPPTLLDLTLILGNHQHTDYLKRLVMPLTDPPTTWRSGKPPLITIQNRNPKQRNIDITSLHLANVRFSQVSSVFTSIHLKAYDILLGTGIQKTTCMQISSDKVLVISHRTKNGMALLSL